MSVDTPRGTRNPTLVIEADADAYSGSLTGPRGRQEIERIDVDGDRFSFPLRVTMPMGEMDMIYEGTVSGDRVSGTIGNPMGSIPFSGTRATAD